MFTNIWCGVTCNKKESTVAKKQERIDNEVIGVERLLPYLYWGYANPHELTNSIIFFDSSKTDYYRLLELNLDTLGRVGKVVVTREFFKKLQKGAIPIIPAEL